MTGLIDTSVRDGNQSLWGATGLTTAMLLEAAPLMDRVGFEAIDFTTSTHMAVAARFQKENPWERIRLMREAMPETPLSFLTTGMRFISWETASAELMQLAFSALVNSGIRRFAIMDPMNDTAAMAAMAQLARKVGVETIVAAMTYTVSPFHDDANYTTLADQLVASKKFDALYLKDPGGLLTPERARVLLPCLRKAAGVLPLELHSHCTIGLAPFSYLVGADAGVNALHTAVTPLANGSSQPSAERIIANLRDAGHKLDIDDAALAGMTGYFTALAEAEGLEQGAPRDYDASYFKHQMPGGMLGTLKRQLDEMKRSNLLPRVLEETERVRADLGYPIMVTPFSQIVGTQAVMNIVSGERYATIPDEVTRYVIGRFGKPTMKLDARLEDQVRSSARAKELAAEPDMAPVSELRKKFARGISDEEFLLRATMPAEQVDAMLAAGPARRSYNPSARPVMELLRGIASLRGVKYVRIQAKGVTMEARSA